MSDGYTPTTDEVRDSIRNWEISMEELDRWLERVKAEAKAEALEEARAEFDEFSINANEQVMPGASGWRFVTVGEWLDAQAAAIRAAAENGES